MIRKPRIFIGSSVESLDIADAVNLNLDHKAEVTIWKNGTFDLSSNTIDSLINKSKSVDFSLFIFSPDDIAIIREEEKHIVRDNVIFELGLFIGAIGKERCFILKPRGMDLHFPTDLLGITLADYEANRSDGDMASAVNQACVLIKKQMEKLKQISHIENFTEDKKSPTVVKDLSSYDFNVLSELLSTATESPNGQSLYWVKSQLKDESRKIDLSIIRLEKLGYIDKRNEFEAQGYGNDNEYFSYTITNAGIELLLENEPLDDIHF